MNIFCTSKFHSLLQQRESDAAAAVVAVRCMCVFIFVSRTFWPSGWLPLPERGPLRPSSVWIKGAVKEKNYFYSPPASLGGVVTPERKTACGALQLYMWTNAWIIFIRRLPHAHQCYLYARLPFVPMQKSVLHRCSWSGVSFLHPLSRSLHSSGTTVKLGTSTCFTIPFVPGEKLSEKSVTERGVGYISIRKKGCSVLGGRIIEQRGTCFCTPTSSIVLGLRKWRMEVELIYLLLAQWTKCSRIDGVKIYTDDRRTLFSSHFGFIDVVGGKKYANNASSMLG